MMKRLKEMMLYLINGISIAIFRFPLTVTSLVGATLLIWYMISLHASPSLVIEKAMFTLLVGAFIGMAAQFAIERFEKFSQRRLVVYGVAALLTAGYFMILLPVPEISQEIGIRTFVAVFAMLCAVLWLPTFNEKTDFNQVALIHFKSAFTSILYSGVLSGGFAAIIAAVDILLFSIDSDAYAYMLTFIWVLFATVYYLSLLPKFNSEEEVDRERLETARNYPRFLEILESYIAIPLVGTYTLVLLAYFVKILVTRNWPSGQLGPMVLVYAAAGLLIFVLAGLLENRFAVLYRKIFPKVLIPIVIMQLISVGIRLNAYGVTESRYYVALFGVFSIVIAVIFSVKPTVKNSLIALLAAAFAILSILPPVDAFTVSRVSQINRIEKILLNEGILEEGKLTPNENASEHTRVETTNILTYLDRSSSLQYIAWLPEDFNVYQDMKSTFGFETTYPNYPGNAYRYFNASLDTQKPMVISDYDVLLTFYSNRYMKEETNPSVFTLKNVEYTLTVKRLSNQEARVSISDSSGTELVGTGLYDFAEALAETESNEKQALAPEEMTLDVSQNGYTLRIIFQNINISYGPEPDAGADYSGQILFGDMN